MHVLLGAVVDEVPEDGAPVGHREDVREEPGGDQQGAEAGVREEADDDEGGGGDVGAGRDTGEHQEGGGEKDKDRNWASSFGTKLGVCNISFIRCSL